MGNNAATPIYKSLQVDTQIMCSLHKLQQILFKPETELSPSINGDLGEDKTTTRKSIFSYYPRIQAVFISFHMKLHSNTFSILLLGFSSANHFL